MCVCISVCESVMRMTVFCYPLSMYERARTFALAFCYALGTLVFRGLAIQHVRVDRFAPDLDTRARSFLVYLSLDLLVSSTTTCCVPIPAAYIEEQSVFPARRSRNVIFQVAHIVTISDSDSLVLRGGSFSGTTCSQTTSHAHYPRCGIEHLGLSMECFVPVINRKRCLNICNASDVKFKKALILLGAGKGIRRHGACRLCQKEKKREGYRSTKDAPLSTKARFAALRTHLCTRIYRQVYRWRSLWPMRYPCLFPLCLSSFLIYGSIISEELDARINAEVYECVSPSCVSRPLLDQLFHSFCFVRRYGFRSSL